MLSSLPKSRWHWVVLTASFKSSQECFDFKCVGGHSAAQAFKVKPDDIVLSHVSGSGLELVTLDPDWTSVSLLSYIASLHIEGACSNSWSHLRIVSNSGSECSL